MAVFRWRHFAGEIILWAVRWYCRYGISYRELEKVPRVKFCGSDLSAELRAVRAATTVVQKAG